MLDPLDDLAQRARELALAGAWTDVVRLLGPQLSFAKRAGELRLLYAEALLRIGRELQACEWLRGVVLEFSHAGDRANHRRGLNLLGAAAFALGKLDEASTAFTNAI